jgi:membrane protein DedA with SNARE-associated domain
VAHAGGESADEPLPLAAGIGVIDAHDLAELAGYAYLVIFLLAAFDVVVPILPSESVVILGAVLAQQGRLSGVSVFLAGAVGAIVGDHLSYGLGRWSRRGKPVGRALGRPGTRSARVQSWAAQQLHGHGPAILLVARFIPGGRTAGTFMSGRLAFPLRRFSPITILAGPLWAGFGVALGYLGGRAFHDNTLLATGLGVLIGTAIALAVDLSLRRWTRRGRAALAGELASDDDELAA